MHIHNDLSASITIMETEQGYMQGHMSNEVLGIKLYFNELFSLHKSRILVSCFSFPRFFQNKSYELFFVFVVKW